MFAIIAAFLLLALQQMPMTVEQCLLRSGYSASVAESEITALRGYPALEWETVLEQGRVFGMAYVPTDTGPRITIGYLWGGAFYMFVGKSEHDPNVRLPGEARSVVHGDCLLKIGD